MNKRKVEKNKENEENRVNRRKNSIAITLIDRAAYNLTVL